MTTELISVLLLLVCGTGALCLYFLHRIRGGPHDPYVQDFRAYAVVGLGLGSIYLLTYLYH